MIAVVSIAFVLLACAAFPFLAAMTLDTAEMPG